VSPASTLARPHVFRPASAPGRPPLLLLHGTGDDEHGLLGLGEALSPGAALLSPRGTVREGAANRFFRRLREGVFDEDDLRERSDELAGFVRAAVAEHGPPSASPTAATPPPRCCCCTPTCSPGRC
jgi:phospholipase/carboxylesterase